MLNVDLNSKKMNNIYCHLDSNIPANLKGRHLPRRDWNESWEKVTHWQMATASWGYIIISSSRGFFFFFKYQAGVSYRMKDLLWIQLRSDSDAVSQPAAQAGVRQDPRFSWRFATQCPYNRIWGEKKKKKRNMIKLRMLCWLKTALFPKNLDLMINASFQNSRGLWKRPFL